MLNAIEENRIIEMLAGGFSRSPLQMNSRHETDAEIVSLADNCTLAITTDSIAEEIALGLYADPYQIGWMTVMVNLSDLAAVAAEPIGLVISEMLASSCTQEFLARLHAGIDEACRASGTYVLGGDINSADRLAVTGTAIGCCPNGRFNSRLGCQPGDLLFATNRLGLGNAFALMDLLHAPSAGATAHPEGLFLPYARLREGKALRGISTACMDSSDGVLAALDQLMRLNGIGFALDSCWDASLDPWARQVARNAGIPEWLLLAGQNGEYELLFTISPARIKELTRRAEDISFRPILLGKALSDPILTLQDEGATLLLDTTRIRNCAGTINQGVHHYLKELLTIECELRKGMGHHAHD